MLDISLIINNYNNSEYVEDCLFSIENQGLLPREIIIVDDCSTDDSVEKMKKSKLAQSFVLLRNEVNMGISYSRNRAILLASSTFLIFLDSDDYLSTNFFEKARIYLSENNSDLVYFNYQLFGNVNRVEIPKYESFSQLLIGNLFPVTSIIRRKNAIECGLFNTNMTKGLEDWDFFIRYLNHGRISIGKIDEVLFYYRKHSKSRNVSMNRHNPTSAYFEMLNVLYSNNINDYLINFENPIVMIRALRKKEVRHPLKRFVKRLVLKIRNI